MVPVLGWWKWRRNGRGRESGSIPVQRADRRSYIIGATILVGAGLTVALPMAIQGALSPVPSMQLPLVLISFLTAGLQLVTLLGFAFGVVESWWLLLANSALYLANFALNMGSTMAGIPQLGSGPPVIMLILHGAIIFFAVKGYRTWRTALASQRVPAPYDGLL
ncbi:nicotinamide mononucleotide transporter [Arthrobacter monumenti]